MAPVGWLVDFVCHKGGLYIFPPVHVVIIRHYGFGVFARNFKFCVQFAGGIQVCFMIQTIRSAGGADKLGFDVDCLRNNRLDLGGSEKCSVHIVCVIVCEL